MVYLDEKDCEPRNYTDGDLLPTPYRHITLPNSKSHAAVMMENYGNAAIEDGFQFIEPIRFWACTQVSHCTLALSTER
jgi:hypothetical protein